MKPHSVAPPVPQLYNTDLGPSEVFGSALTEVWQVKIGERDEKVVEARGAWEKFVSAVAEAGGVNGNGDSIQGTSLNLEEKRWVGVVGWESSEVSLELSFKFWVENSWLTLILDERESTWECSCEGSEKEP